MLENDNYLTNAKFWMGFYGTEEILLENTSGAFGFFGSSSKNYS